MTDSMAAPAPRGAGTSDNLELVVFDGGDARDRAEIAAIQEALAACNGNQTRAAEKRGRARRTLIEKLDPYGLPRPRKS